MFGQEPSLPNAAGRNLGCVVLGSGAWLPIRCPSVLQVFRRRFWPMRGAVLLLVSAVSANREMTEYEAGSGSVAPSPSPSPRTYAGGGQCSTDWCTSPDTTGYHRRLKTHSGSKKKPTVAHTTGSHDCYAGSHDERCTCSRGMAQETGVQTEYEV